MNNRKIHFHMCWLVDTLLENKCVLVRRSLFLLKYVSQLNHYLQTSMGQQYCTVQRRKHAEPAEPVDEADYRCRQSCALERYVVALHRPQ